MSDSQDSSYEKDVRRKTLQAAYSQYRGRLGIQRVLIMAAAANGMQWGPGERLSTRTLGKVLQYAFQPVHAAGPSYARRLASSKRGEQRTAAGYDSVDNTWREISARKPVNEKFQDAPRIDCSTTWVRRLRPGGSIKEGTVSDG